MYKHDIGLESELHYREIVLTGSKRSVFPFTIAIKCPDFKMYVHNCDYIYMGDVSVC